MKLFNLEITPREAAQTRDNDQMVSLERRASPVSKFMKGTGWDKIDSLAQASLVLLNVIVARRVDEAGRRFFLDGHWACFRYGVCWFVAICLQIFDWLDVEWHIIDLKFRKMVLFLRRSSFFFAFLAYFSAISSFFVSLLTPIK